MDIFISVLCPLPTGSDRGRPVAAHDQSLEHVFILVSRFLRSSVLYDGQMLRLGRIVETFMVFTISSTRFITFWRTLRLFMFTVSVFPSFKMFAQLVTLTHFQICLWLLRFLHELWFAAQVACVCFLSCFHFLAILTRCGATNEISYLLENKVHARFRNRFSVSDLFSFVEDRHFNKS